MNIKTNKFLTLGYSTLKASVLVVGLVAALGTTAIFANGVMANSLSKYGADKSFVQNSIQTIDDFAYLKLKHPILQKTEDFRKVVFERALINNQYQSLIKLDDWDKENNQIIKDNIEKAEKLGLFKDQNSLEFQQELILIAFNNPKIDSAYKKDHFDVKDISQLKNKIQKNMVVVENQINLPSKKF